MIRFSSTCCNCTPSASTRTALRGQIGGNGDLAGHQFAAQQLKGLGDQAIEVQRRQGDGAPPVERAEAADHFGGAMVLGDDVAADLAKLDKVRSVAPQHGLGGLGVGKDRRQRLVELMGDRGRELAQHIDPRHVAERLAVLFGPLLGRALPLHAQPPRDQAGEHLGQQAGAVDRRSAAIHAPDGYSTARRRR